MKTGSGRLILAAMSFALASSPGWSASALEAFGRRVHVMEQWEKMSGPTQRHRSRFSASLIGCDGRAPAPPRIFRGPSRAESSRSDCALLLPGLGSMRFRAGNLLEVQESSSSFHLVEGTPIPDRVWIPGLLVGLKSTPFSVGIGTSASSRLRAVVALTLTF
jgi:hypothetical protein